MKIIGIVGPSCSGKSTVAKLVAKELESPYMSLDLQPIKGVPHILVDGVRTFERPELYDGNKLARILDTIQKKGVASFTEYNHATKSWYEMVQGKSPYVIIEGFLLYQYPALRDACHHKFYIDLPWEAMVKRRLDRGRGDKSDESFFKIGQIESQNYVVPQKTMPGVVVLDGMLTPTELAHTIVQRVIKH